MGEQFVDRVLDLAITLQQIPAPTFAEARRAAYVQEQFRREGLHDVATDSMGNVFGRLPGVGMAQSVIISAHLDTVFPEDADLQVQRTSEKIVGPGIGDNSLGVAGLFGLLWMLRQREESLGYPLPGDIWFVANVGEEGLGDLRGMRAVVERFREDVRGYIIIEGMALGQIYHRGLGVQRYRITVRTTGGHSWVDYGRPSAIHELAAFITRLEATELPEKPRTTRNVGVISGGTTVNTIAAEACLELDLRSEDLQTLEELSAQVRALVAAANKPGARLMVESIGHRPAGEISPDHTLVRLALRCLASVGIQPHLNIGSTDANIPLSLGLPAICLGLTTGGGAHTMSEFINTRPLAKGMAQLAALVEQINR
jgi:acetylornithine deacetylase/succinyl-diaminopimelate desuccinylase-like protein